ncbi:thrombospondin type 3 repeat-containing protein, partial [Myxococcota bacterium]|nr:thrombospondin type 3 repeat-containing protein [Myxococcota bacterium]
DSSNWIHDASEGRPDSYNDSFRLEAPATNCHLVQSLDVTEAFTSEKYFLSAWVKASSDVVNLAGSVVFGVTTSSGTTEFPLDLPSSIPGEGWVQLTLPVEHNASGELVTQAQISVRASMDAGTLWVDELTLYEWDRVPFPFGRFADSNGWNRSAGSGTFQFDSGHGRLDSTSLKMPYPMQMDGLSAHHTDRYEPFNFQAGRYVLSAWVKAERTVLAELSIDQDQDQDRLPDDFEIFLGLDPNDPDMDNDGYDDGLEFVSNSSPTNPDSVPTPWFPIHSDISLKLYAEDLAGGNPTQHLRAEYLTLPSSIYLADGDWYYYSHIFDISEAEARSIRAGKIQVRAFKTTAAGSYWIDDLQIRRLSGDLRNLLGASQPPILKQPSGELYQEGLDYEVCQMGANENECNQPFNYTRTLQGGLASTYQEDRPPFEIRWLDPSPPTEKRITISYDIGAQYTKVSTAQRGWDGTSYTRGELNFCNVDQVADGIGLDAVFDRAMANYTLPDFPPNGGEDYVLNADLVSWSVSEVRGMNRSLACLDDQGNHSLSNAGRFANLVNRAFSMLKTKSSNRPESNFRYVMWDDMFNPFNNGGDPDYQVKYGGIPGRSACSYAPYRLAEICEKEIEEVEAGKFVPIVQNEGLIMEPWSYYPNTIRRMVATSSFYEKLGVTSHVLPADNLVNIEDWAGISNQFGRIEGVHATYFQVTPGSENLSGTRLGLHAFWNHDWKLLYLHDNETPDSSFYQIPWPLEPALTFENATHDTSGSCASSVQKFEGNNDGGLCLASTGIPKVALHGIPTKGGRTYRVGLLARRHPDYQSEQATSEVPIPSAEVIWSNGESAGPIAVTRVYDSTDKSNSDGFDRYRIEFEAPAEDTAMSVAFDFGPSGRIIAADDIVIFESTPRCFNHCSIDPYLQDSDGDGLSDGWEGFYGFNPNVRGEDTLDPDLDGLTNLWEQNYNGDPFLPDTDGDGASDGEEAAAGTLLDDPNSRPPTL